MIPPLSRLAVLGFLAPTLSVRADEPDARRLLDEVLRTYKGLPSYSDTGAITIAMKVDGKEQARSWPFRLALARPNKIAIDAGEVRLVSDGAKLTTTTVVTRRYLEGPAPATVRLDTITEGPMGALLLGGPSGRPALALLALLLGDDPASILLEGATGLRLDRGEAEGKPTAALVIERGDEPALRLGIDPQTKLVQRIDLAFDPKALADRAPAGVTLADARIGWAAGPITTQPPKPEVFAFKPPEGFRPIQAPDGGDRPKGAAAAKPDEDRPDP